MPSTYNEFVGFQKQLANYNQNWLISLQWDNFCDFGATFSGFGTLFTNIILLWIQTFEKNALRTDGRTNRRTDRQTDPHIEMRGRI